jgi:hypothetical protein
MQQMPWTQNLFTPEQTRQWVASRKEAGAAIDIETCELDRWHADDDDRYGVNPDCEMLSMGRTYFVRSPTSNGWINEGHLPVEKIRAMYDRVERNRGLWEAACAVHPMFEAGGMWQWKWKGEGEEPSPNAMREWFKVNHPTLASEAEREIRARIKEKRERADDFELPF